MNYKPSAEIPSQESTMPLALQLVLIAAAWGTGVLFIKIIVGSGMPPFALAACRGGLAGLGIAFWLFVVQRQSVSLTLPTIKSMVMLGLFNGLVPNVLLALALSRIDSAPAGMIQAATPLFVVLLAALFLPSEHIRAKQIVGLILGTVGLFLVIGPTAITTGQATVNGALLVVLVAFSYAVSAVYLRRTRPANPTLIALGQQVVATSIAVALSAGFEREIIFAPNTTTWFSLLGLGILSTAGPTILYLGMLTSVPAAKAALVHYLVPLAAVVYGVALLGERLTMGAIIGGIVVLAGAWIATRPATGR